MIADIENALVARLLEPLKPLVVESFPGDPQGYRLGSKKGAVLVVYQGSRRSPSRDRAVIAQERTMLFDLVVMVRDLRSHIGAYPVLKTIDRLVLGFRPAGAAAMWVERDEYIGHDDGVWSYSVTAATRIMSIADQSLPIAPLLTEVNYEEQA